MTPDVITYEICRGASGNSSNWFFRIESREEGQERGIDLF